MSNFYLTLIMMILGLFLLFIGLRIIISKKPIIISSKYFLFLILIFFISMLIFSNLDDFLKGDLDYFKTGVILLLLIIFFVYMFKFFHGYQLIGIDDEAFRKCISQSLDNLGLEYKEDFSKIIIDKYDLTIYCTVQSWIGKVHIRFKGRVDKKFISSLIDELNKNINSAEIFPKKVSAYFYTLIGFLSTLISVYYLLKIF